MTSRGLLEGQITVFMICEGTGRRDKSWLFLYRWKWASSKSWCKSRVFWVIKVQLKIMKKFVGSHNQTSGWIEVELVGYKWNFRVENYQDSCLLSLSLHIVISFLVWFPRVVEEALSTHSYSSSLMKEEKEPLPTLLFQFPKKSFWMVGNVVRMWGWWGMCYQNEMRKNIGKTQVMAISHLKWKLLLCALRKDCIHGRRDLSYIWCS